MRCEGNFISARKSVKVSFVRHNGGIFIDENRCRIWCCGKGWQYTYRIAPQLQSIGFRLFSTMAASYSSTISPSRLCNARNPAGSWASDGISLADKKLFEPFLGALSTESFHRNLSFCIDWQFGHGIRFLCSDRYIDKGLGIRGGSSHIRVVALSHVACYLGSGLKSWI